jgi:hypothetical protein
MTSDSVTNHDPFVPGVLFLSQSLRLQARCFYYVTVVKLLSSFFQSASDHLIARMQDSYSNSL